MRSTHILLCLPILAALSSCVKEDLSDCPPEAGRIVVAVQDKNYDNAAEVGAPVIDENLPMISYVRSLVVRNHVRDTGRDMVFDETLLADELVHPLAASRFSPGMNDVTVTGGSGAGAKQYVEGKQSIELHPGGGEGEDTYVGYDEVAYPPPADRTILLYRAKGMLTVEPANMPAGVRTVEISVSGLYAGADGGAGGLPIYDGTTSVKKMFDIATGGAGTRFSTMLAPSAGTDGSTLTIVFTLADGTTESIALRVAIVRNHITLVRPTYDLTRNIWTIEVLVDGTWQRIENLNIIDE